MEEYATQGEKDPIIREAEFERALSEFRVALSAAPDDVPHNYFYAEALEAAGHMAEAKAAFEKTATMSTGPLADLAATEAAKLK
jgi:Flp pilus assembly protein TadD